MENKNPLILLISASIRSVSNEADIVENVKKLESETYLYEYIENVARDRKISNSEGGLVAAAYGASRWTDNIEYIRLNKYFLKNGEVANCDEVLEKIKRADGIIFSTPVYFGDRSSLMHDFIRVCEKEKISFSSKVVGFISTGAKRNGGQETTNVYAIHNLTELSALTVGNGPPTSQYGGTCVGGEMGTMENDYFGIMTSQGVGTKVAQVATLVLAGKDGLKTNNEKTVIDFWILEDENEVVKKYIEHILKKYENRYPNVEFNLLDLTKNNFHRCFGCSVCPHEKDKTIAFKCINRKDDMINLHDRLTSSDAIIVSGLSLEDVNKKETVYQRFIERTRYIRRDNFLLTNKLAMALSLNQLPANSLFNLRVLTSFIRHNVVFHKGFEEYMHNGKIVADRSEEFESILDSFVENAKILKIGRKTIDIGHQGYVEIGY